MGGNSLSIAQGVFRGRGRRAGQNFSGSAGAICAAGGIDVVEHAVPSDGSGSRSRCSAHFVKSTVFCGFSRVHRQAVAWPPSHGMAKGTDFCGSRAACRLIVSYPPSAARSIEGGPMGSRAQLASAGGRPPFVLAWPLHARRASAGRQLEKMAEPALLAVGCHKGPSGRAELSRSQTGSGVRVPQRRRNSAGKGRFCAKKAGDRNGVGGKIARHLLSDVVDPPMLCRAMNRVN